jgi:signal transduction histidine kinase
MSELVENLLDFARTQLGEGMRLAPVQIVDLAEDLRHVVDELVVTGREVDYKAMLEAPVACDPRRVAQLLSNLLANAIRHGDPFGPVRVRARSDAARFELSVTNIGPALPPEVRERLFQPFIRSQQQGRAREGLGLGLFIVSEIARAHGGTMHVESDDSLTRFTFRLPQPVVAGAAVPA